MKYRVSNIIETLRRLPPPERHGEIRRFPILLETWEIEFNMNHSCLAMKEETITVEAKAFSDRSVSRLEWMIEIN